MENIREIKFSLVIGKRNSSRSIIQVGLSFVNGLGKYCLKPNMGSMNHCNCHVLSLFHIVSTYPQALRFLIHVNVV